MGGPAARGPCGWETCGAVAMAAGVRGGIGLGSSFNCAWDESPFTRAAGGPVAQCPKGAGRGAGFGGWVATGAEGGAYSFLFFFPLPGCIPSAGVSKLLAADAAGASADNRTGLVLSREAWLLALVKRQARVSLWVGFGFAVTSSCRLRT